MFRKKRQAPERRKPRTFVRCPECSYDFITGEGVRRCGWYECPYLPEELKVFCPVCNYNFATREGNPRCSDPPSCERAAPGYRRAREARKFFGVAD